MASPFRICLDLRLVPFNDFLVELRDPILVKFPGDVLVEFRNGELATVLFETFK